jgi:hypothetical protein
MGCTRKLRHAGRRLIGIQNTGHYFGLHVSPATAKALIQKANASANASTANAST